MTSTTSFRNFGRQLSAVWGQSLRQIRGITLLYGILTLVFIPLVLIFLLTTSLQTTYSYSSYPVVAIERAIRTLFPVISSPLVSIFSLVYSFVLCHYMQNKRSIDVYHSLPLGRIPMLLGRFLASLTAHALVLAVNALCLLGILVGFQLYATPQGVVLPILVLHSILIQFLMAGAMTAFTFVAIVCCGTAFDSLVSIFGINISVPIVIFLCFSYIAGSLPGYTSSIAGWSSQYFFMSPFIGIYFMACFNTDLLWWWLLSIPLFLGLSLLLYGFRKSEAAEISFAFPLPKIIIRFLITLAGGMAVGSIAHSLAGASYYLWFILGSFCSHLVLEVIYDRGFRFFPKSLIAYGTAVAISCAFFGIIAFGGFGFDTAVPSAESVAWVEYSGREELTLLDSNNRKHTFSSVVTESQRFEDLQKSHEETIENIRAEAYPYFYRNPLFSGALFGGDFSSVSFTYHLKDGGTLHRTYNYSYSAYTSSLENFFSSEKNPQESVYQLIPPELISKITISIFDNMDGTATETEFPATFAQKSQILDVLSKEEKPDGIAGETATEYTGVLTLSLSGEEFSLSPSSFYYSQFPEGTKFHFPDYSDTITVDISENTPEMIKLLEDFQWLPGE
ncbi:MAG: hypothetical protein ACLU62_07270 [Hydrogeniiclostridium sp.]